MQGPSLQVKLVATSCSTDTRMQDGQKSMTVMLQHTVAANVKCQDMHESAWSASVHIVPVVTQLSISVNHLQTFGKPAHWSSQSVSLQSQLIAQGVMHRSPSRVIAVLGLAASQPLSVSMTPPC